MRASTKSGAQSSKTYGGAAVSTDDIALNKSASIERGVQRVREVYANDPRNLTGDQLRQDSIVLNRTAATPSTCSRTRARSKQSSQRA
jgi:hypothetical protein